jgi:hypothetical protein
MTEHKPWLSLPDEEPPERGLAELMAAARVKAEVMTHPPWWKRLLAMLRRPPVLALATVVVLLGGVIVIGRHHDQAASPAPSLDVPPGHLETRERGSVLEPPPPPPPPPHQAVEKQLEAPRGDLGGQVQDEEKLDTTAIAPKTETQSVDDRAELKKAGSIRKAGLEKPADPLSRCRAAAARRDCAAAKACVKDLGNVDVANDAAFKSCL